jgi:hypothetical protein
MAKVLGFNPTQTNDYFEVNEKAKALRDEISTLDSEIQTL